MEASISSPGPYFGIDLGGTKVLALVGMADGQVLGKALVSTPADQGPERVVKTMADAAREAVRQAGTEPGSEAAVGVAAAGAIDRQRGVVVHSPNLKGWDQVPLREMLSEAMGRRVVIVNDANLAALGEHRYGAGRGVRNLLYMTVSTGVGGGIIIDNALYQGDHGFAGEIGHITINAGGVSCACGNRGCLETLVSGTALARETRRRLEAGEKSLLGDIPRDEGGAALTAEHLFAAFHKGDSVARSVVDEAVHYLAPGLQSLVNIFDPGKFIIGGGLSHEWESYIQPAIALMRERSFAGVGRELQVVPPELGVNAGALGAIAVAAEQV